jgi:hypothetical protein
VEEIDIVTSAKKIHRGRSGNFPEIPACQAGAEVLLADVYGLDVTLNSYDKGHISWRDASGRKVTVVGSETELMLVDRRLLVDYDVVIFAIGREVDDLDVVGWMPTDWIGQAPALNGPYEIRQEFCISLPDEFDFITPDTSDTIRVWNHELEGWWTPNGYYIYDRAASQRIPGLESELVRGVS